MSDAFQPPLSTREERVAYNEAWARDLNRQRAEWRSLVGNEFRCECWQSDCDSRLRLSEEEWQLVRSQPNRFAVVPGHVADDVEAVIKKHPGFWLIEKLGKAGQIAETLG